MQFIAPEQAPEQADVIKNTPFWPDVDAARQSKRDTLTTNIGSRL